MHSRRFTGGQVTEASRFAASCGKIPSVRGTYVTLNPLRDGNGSAKAGDVVKRRWLLVDVDPDRPDESNATQEEKAQARQVTRAVKSYLDARGWPQPLVIDSGNGWHLLFRINEPADQETQELLRDVLARLADRFDTAEAHVDRQVHDAPRITKLPGTWARKGPHGKERPHRQARLFQKPDSIRVVTREQLLEVAHDPVGNPSRAAGKADPRDPFTGKVEGDSARAAKYARKALDGEAERVRHAAVGERNNLLNRAAFRIGQLVAAGALTRAEVVAVLSAAAAAAGLPEREILTTIESGLNKGAENPRAIPEGTKQARGQTSSQAGATSAAANPPPTVLKYRPFPTDALPAPIGEYVRQMSSAMSIDPAFIGLPALVAAAGLVGNARVIRLGGEWREPCVLWAAVVASSGSMKSPAFSKALEPVNRLEGTLVKAHRQAMTEFRRRKEAAGGKGRRGKQTREGTQEEPPVKPTRMRVLVSDTTIEGLQVLLESCPRGLLLARDELSGWLNFTRYKKSSDLADWLTMHRAEPMTVDRKLSRHDDEEGSHYHIPRAAVSVVGTVQPGTLRRAMTPENVESGLVARLLMAYPPEQKKHEPRVAEIDRPVKDAYGRVMTNIFRLVNPLNETDGGQSPQELVLSSEAWEEWIRFFRHWAEKQYIETNEQRRAALAKLEGYVGRLAMLHHVVEDVHAGGRGLGPVGVRSLLAATKLVSWFCRESDRIIQGAALDDGEKDSIDLVTHIERLGRPAMPRDLTRHNNRRWKSADQARATLDALVASGLGRWVEFNTPKGNPVRGVEIVKHGAGDTDDQDDDDQGSPREDVTIPAGEKHVHNAADLDGKDDDDGILVDDEAGPFECA
ncbi:MAG: YfjI family protein [Gemmataceae bacterium]